MPEDDKKKIANRQREDSRRQVQRNVKLAPEVSELLDTLKSDTGLSLSDLLGEALGIAAPALREKYKPKI